MSYNKKMPSEEERPDFRIKSNKNSKRVFGGKEVMAIAITELTTGSDDGSKMVFEKKIKSQ